METKIQFELKGRLQRNLNLDIKVKPFYHRDEFTKAPAVIKASEFKICQNIFVFDIEKSVERALDTLERAQTVSVLQKMTPSI
jgi:methylmalonyl-CoA mutase